jgi:hypothetical protein
MSGLGSGPAPVAVSSTVIGGGESELRILILAMIYQIFVQGAEACRGYVVS